MSAHTVPTIKSMMTPFPHSIDVDTPLLKAQEMMDTEGIRHLPVREKGELVGILSDRDINLALSIGMEHLKSEEITVRAAYSPNPYCVDVDTSIVKVLGQMVERHIGSALVLKKEKLVGIFTTTDACRKFKEFLEKQFNLIETDPEVA